MKFIACISFLLLSYLSWSQNSIALPAVQNFDKKTYQAGAQNWDMQQDKDGNIYVANNEGLLVFDGSRWQIYPLNNHTIVRSVCIDPKGRVYVGGQDEIGYFEPDQSGKLVYHSLTNRVPAQFAAMGDVWDIVYQDQSVFFRSFNVILRFQNEAFVGYGPKEEWRFMGRSGNFVIAQDSQQGLMMFRNQGWFPIDAAKSLPKDVLVTAILSAPNRQVLITTLKHGLYIWKEDQILPWGSPASTSVWQQMRIYHATALSQNRFALATSVQGIYVIDQTGNIIQRIAKPEGLQNNNVLHVFADRQENLWLGLDNGIDCVAFSSAIKKINPRLEDGAGYAALLFQHQLLLGTSNGLYRVDTHAAQELDFLQGEFSPVKGLTGQIWGLNAINNQVLIGHHEGAFSLTKDQVEPIHTSTGYWTFLPLTQTYPADQIVAGNYKGLSIFPFQDKVVSSFQSIPNFQESSRFIAIDAEQQIWVSHPYHGTFRIRKLPNGQTETKIFARKEGLPGTLNNHIFSVRQEILAATDQGVYRYQPKSQRFEAAQDYQNWLGHISIRHLKEDLQGNVWFVHEKQVGMLDFSGGEPKKINFPELNSKILSGFEMIYPVDTQRVLIGAERGFFLVNYKAYKAGQTPLPIQIRGVHLLFDRDSLLFGGYSPLTTNSASPINRISHQWKSIRFEYASAMFPTGQALEYCYRLKGFDTQWSGWTNRTEKEYTNLPEGNYTFEVRARTSTESESAIRSFSFVVLPPWYRSGYSIIAYILLGILAGWYLYRWQRKKFIAQQQKYEQEQQKLLYIHELERNKAESELVALRNEKLESEINFKNSEMAASAMHLVQKGELMATMKEELRHLMKVIDHPKAISEIKNIIKRLSDDENVDQEWDQFSKYFDKVHSDFVSALKQQHPSLTPSESKLCIYLRMNLSTKEIAQLLNISVRGVEISRYRLRKKLQLSKEQNLFDYLIQIRQS